MKRHDLRVKHLHYNPKLDSNPDLSMNYFFLWKALMQTENTEHSGNSNSRGTFRVEQRWMNSSTEPSVFPYLKRSFIRSIPLCHCTFIPSRFSTIQAGSGKFCYGQATLGLIIAGGLSSFDRSTYSTPFDKN